jgi:N utilization substance protein A
MLRRLLEREVPEIYNGTVEIKSIAREPGQRSKVAVVATQPGVDPVGSCVGMRGTRIQNIVDELGGEKIDVVEWSSDVRHFIANALSPAKPSDTLLIEDSDVRTAIVIVPDRQLSLAIGKEGQNARLAAKLTGWRIDIKSDTEAATEGLAEIKRQQLQLLRARSLETRAATAPPANDLLGRAEWLLREKDKMAMTLEQAARKLAKSETPAEGEALPRQPEEAQVTAAAPAPVEAAASVEPAAGEVRAQETPQPQELALQVPGPGLGKPADQRSALDGEESEEEDAGHPKRKKASKKRQLVYDEQLGEVVTRRKRRTGPRDWGDEYEDF